MPFVVRILYKVVPSIPPGGFIVIRRVGSGSWCLTDEVNEPFPSAAAAQDDVPRVVREDILAAQRIGLSVQTDGVQADGVTRADVVSVFTVGGELEPIARDESDM